MRGDPPDQRHRGQWVLKQETADHPGLPRAVSSSRAEGDRKGVQGTTFPSVGRKSLALPITSILAIVSVITVNTKMKDSELFSGCSLK